MTLDITIDGSGEVGHVASWSIKESATQHSLAQSSGSVGSLDLSAAAVEGRPFTRTTEVRRNLCRNPSLSVDATYWQSFPPDLTGSRETSAGYVGNHFYRGTAGVDITPASDEPLVGSALSTSMHAVVVEGETYIVSAYIRTSHTVDVRASMNWRTAAGAFISNSVAPTVSIPAGVWTRVTASGVAPPTAAFGGFRALATGTQTYVSGSTIDVDAVLIEVGSTLGDYFDGSNSPDVDLTPAWTGTDGLSESTLSSSTVVPGRFGVSRSTYLNDCGISVNDGTGAWSGRIMDAPMTGAAVSVKAEGALRFLNAVRTAPPAGRFVLPVTAVGGQGSGDGQFLYPADVVFDSSGNMFVADRGNFRIQKFTPDGNGGWTYSAQTPYTTVGNANGQFAGLISGLAVDSSDNVYATDTSNNRVQKFTNGLVYSAQVGSAGSGNGQFTLPRGIAIDASNNVYVLDSNNRRIQRFNTSLTYQAQFALAATGGGISWDAITGDLFVTQWYGSGSTPYHNIRRYSTAGVYSGYATLGGLGVGDGYFTANPAASTTNAPEGVVTLSDGTVVVSDIYGARIQFFDSTLAFLGKFGSYGSGAGEFIEPRGLGVDADDNIYVSDHGNHRIQVFSRASLVNTAPLSEVIESYIRLCDPDSDHAYSYDCATDPEVAFPGWTDVVWRKLNELCAVYNVELYYKAGTVHVGDIGARELDIPNTTVPTRTPESIQPARNVQVVNQNIVAGDGLTMYDAADTNTIHTVDVGTVRSITLATNNHPANLNYPTPVDAAPIGAGQYCVQDSTGLAITAADWTAAGGSVTVAVGEATGTIVLTITGPTATIAGTTAPYSLASGTGETRVATLSITGSGVTTSPEIVTTPTGADPTRIKQEVARTIDVPFIGNLGQAMDAGVWAACDSLFGLTLTFRIPRETGKTFGDYVGRKFTWGNARWRVMDATIDVSGVTITAKWHTTVGEFDAAWSGDTVGDVDTAWDGYLLRDVNMTPLATDLP